MKEFASAFHFDREFVCLNIIEYQHREYFAYFCANLNFGRTPNKSRFCVLRPARFEVRTPRSSCCKCPRIY